MNTYSHLDFNGHPAPKGKHQIVRIENPLLARPLEVYAHFEPQAVTQPEALQWAKGLDAGGLSWRAPTVDEGYFIADRSRWPCFDKEAFFGARSDYPWIWTSTPDPESPASYAFVVLLHSSYVYRLHHDILFHALAVRAGVEVKT